MSVTERMTRNAGLVEEELARLIPGEQAFPPVIHQAMRYTALGGGKRLRAFLAIEACNIVGGEARCALPAACSVEMVHAYSLIHDDLPCMDDDDFRRGKLSNHKVFGEGMAVLAGDALLTLAFETLASRPDDLAPSTRLNMVLELAHAAGCAGMVGGQAVDLTSEGKELDLTTLAYLHASKTGALIRASVCLGAMAGGAGKRELQSLGDYADSFGLAFQITDDILDVVGRQEETGKPVGSDQKHAKATYVSHFGLEKAGDLARSEVEAACRLLTPFGGRAAGLSELALFLLERKS